MLNIETKELKINDKFKSNKLELGVITINLSLIFNSFVSIFNI